MNTWLRLILILLLIGTTGCENEGQIKISVTGTPTPEEEPNFPLEGSWLTDCLDFGNGPTVKIFAEVDSGGKALQAMLIYANGGCTGPYSLYDTQGNPVAEPQHEFDAEEQTVPGIPAGFSVMKITDSNNGEIYIILYRKADSFHELVAFQNPNADWSDWLTEPDVAGFAADPENYQPTAGGMVFHFGSSELP